MDRQSIINDLLEGFQNDYAIGRDDTQQVFYRKRDLQDLNKDAPMAVSMVGNHQGITRLREATGQLNPKHAQALKEANMQLRMDKPLAYRVGQFGGTLAADLTQDTSRGLWWLINALQATGQVVNDAVLQQAVPELWGRSPVERQVSAIAGGRKVTNTRELNMEVANDVTYALKQGMVREEQTVSYLSLIVAIHLKRIKQATPFCKRQLRSWNDCCDCYSYRSSNQHRPRTNDTTWWR